MDQDFFLVKRMKLGDEKALESFVRKYYPAILSYCAYHTASKETAEDLAQETFEHFFRSLGSYSHRGKMANYLYVIAGNLCKNTYAKKGELLERHEPLGDPENPAGQETDAPAFEFSRQSELRMDLEAAMRLLPDELKEVLILYYFQDRTQREICKILGIGLPLVKYRLKKAKEVLKNLLGEENYI